MKGQAGRWHARRPAQTGLPSIFFTLAALYSGGVSLAAFSLLASASSKQQTAEQLQHKNAACAEQEPFLYGNVRFHAAFSAALCHRRADEKERPVLPKPPSFIDRLHKRTLEPTSSGRVLTVVAMGEHLEKEECGEGQGSGWAFLRMPPCL